MLVGPASPRVEEPVLAGFSLAPSGAFDESDDPAARTSVIGLPRKEEPVLARFRLTPTAALDDTGKRSIVNRDATRLPDPRRATMLRVGSSRGSEHRLGVPPVTIQHVR